jgi:hypothetical protein
MYQERQGGHLQDGLSDSWRQTTIGRGSPAIRARFGALLEEYWICAQVCGPHAFLYLFYALER